MDNYILENFEVTLTPNTNNIADLTVELELDWSERCPIITDCHILDKNGEVKHAPRLTALVGAKIEENKNDILQAILLSDSRI